MPVEYDIRNVDYYVARRRRFDSDSDADAAPVAAQAVPLRDPAASVRSINIFNRAKVPPDSALPVPVCRYQLVELPLLRLFVAPTLGSMAVSVRFDSALLMRIASDNSDPAIEI